MGQLGSRVGRQQTAIYQVNRLGTFKINKFRPTRHGSRMNLLSLEGY